jgi:hypothetical protein
MSKNLSFAKLKPGSASIAVKLESGQRLTVRGRSGSEVGMACALIAATIDGEQLAGLIRRSYTGTPAVIAEAARQLQHVPGDHAGRLLLALRRHPDLRELNAAVRAELDAD